MYPVCIFPAILQWFEPFVVSLGISFTLCFIFMVLLPPIRHKEVRAVYW